MDGCAHLADVRRDDGLLGSPPGSEGCEECLAHGGRWVHLRRCLACGHVGCCDSSPGRHATAHHRESAHPLVQSFEPGEDWVWCYADDVVATDGGGQGRPSPAHP